MRALACAAIVAATALAVGCGPTVDLSQKLKIDVTRTGWIDAGIVNGKNKLVPSITFRVTNQSDQTLVSLQVNGLFRRVNEKDEWGSGFVSAAGSQGLAPGATSQELTIRSQLGYTGEDQSRQQLLQNSQFVDAKVELFAKYGSAQWKKMGEFPITRQLIEQP